MYTVRTSLVGPAVHLTASDQADVAEGEQAVFVRDRGGLHAGLQVLRERVRLVLCKCVRESEKQTL